MIKFEKDRDGWFDGVRFDCPGCRDIHFIPLVGDDKRRWKWNGDIEKPTLDPSVKATSYWKDEKKICHFYLKEGVLEFCKDSTHDKAGQKIPYIQS